MTLIYDGHLYQSYEAYVSRRSTRMAPGQNAPAYAHPADQKLLAALNFLRVNKLLDQSVEWLVSVQFGHELSSNPQGSSRSFEKLSPIVAACARQLNIPIPIVVISQQAGLINAFTAGTDDFAFVAIAPTMLHLFTPEELVFIVGHECGHIASGHMTYHTLGSLVANGLGAFLGPFSTLPTLPLQAWVRRGEVTADRAGLLCCGDLEVACRALKRLVVGLGNPDEIDTDDFIRQSQEMSRQHSSANLMEYLQTHPMIPRRLHMLKLFAQSELYYELSGKTPPAGLRLLPKAELDDMVNHILV
ncbi:MAG TPA: M48 family metallopeptidase [Symbiobacteriaceae bacterium]|nr:M48 family metallopeptidase [Symbiobacteriaceae bacterium]